MRLFLNINDYKNIIAQQTSGGYTAGDVISSPLAKDVPGDGTLGAARKLINGGAQVPSQTNYTLSTGVEPIRPFSVEINVPGIGYGKDDGQGNILGFGFSGTVDYSTGDIDLDVGGSAGAGSTVSDPIQIMVDLDVDAADNLESIQAGLVTKDIRAQIWALASDVGAFANFAFAQRFGRSAIDEVAADLTNEITRILNTNAVAALVSNLPTPALGFTEWKTSENNVSYAETFELA